MPKKAASKESALKEKHGAASRVEPTGEDRTPSPAHGRAEPLQPELNIGMIGHVDHGKCIAAEEVVLLNNELASGERLLEFAQKNGRKSRISESESVFDIPNFRAFSLSPNFEPVSVPAKFFVQNYRGKMFKIETKRGKRLTASPKHPLLVHNGAELAWKSAENLKKGEFVAALKRAPGQNFIKDPFPDWMRALSRDCWIATPADFESLSQKTIGFSCFEALEIEDFNKLRIFLKLPVSRLGKKAGIGSATSNALWHRMTEGQKARLVEAFEKETFKKPEGILFNYKKKSQSFCEIRLDNAWDDRILRFLAFVAAEGCLTSNSVRFSQEKNVLLSDILKTCKAVFGIAPKCYPPFDYQIDSKALVCFLKERYGLKVGNSRKAGIPEWVFALPERKMTVFLNAFFSAEANFNTKSRQIALVQANRKSVEILSYCLKKLEIGHAVHEIEKRATNSPNKAKRKYWQIIVSGTKNTAMFQKRIGTSQPQKALALKAMTLPNRSGKKSDEMVPIRFELFSALVEELGWKKKHFSEKAKKLKTQPWFWAYQDCRAKNAVSVPNLELLILECRNRIKELGRLERRLNAASLKKTMADIGISQQDVAKKTGKSQKIVWKLLKSKDRSGTKPIRNALQRIIQEKIARSSELLQRVENNSPQTIEWDKIEKIEEIDYAGKIVDLQVPGYHNFVAGLGGLVSHNTSLTFKLTGKWTDTHSEEIKRGISIRLGYADVVFRKCLSCPAPDCFTTEKKCPSCGRDSVVLRKVSFVDAPGHETLMTTMLSGAALMQGAVLVIAANETVPQPRTAEHVMALELSEVKHIVVAQNKVDLVSREKALENFQQIKEFLKEYGFENAPIIPVSANFGANLDLLMEAIEGEIPTPKFDLKKPLKMYIARSFDINRPGTKVEELKGGALGGSIVEGVVQIGDEVEISPGIDGKPLLSKVESLSTSLGSLKEAKPGGLISIGTQLDSSICRSDQFRGQIVGKPGSIPASTLRLKMEVKYLKRLENVDVQPFKMNEIALISVGTMTAVGNVV
ncbi:MAG: translation initiation factor IF-2 subunit gamma, partial [Candidatus Diapherotrites archaeon]